MEVRRRVQIREVFSPCAEGESQLKRDVFTKVIRDTSVCVCVCVGRAAVGILLGFGLILADAETVLVSEPVGFISSKLLRHNHLDVNDVCRAAASSLI